MRRFLVAACVALAVACLGGAAAPFAQAYVPAGGQGWYWQMPQPAGDLAAVTFASADDVWAVGLGGTILHSGDAGATWTGQQSGTLADLLSVSFGDDQHGWTCGLTATGASIVLATSDGGKTWVDRTPSGLTKTLTNVSFVDAGHGWAGTTDGFAVRTSDGGATWTSSRVGTSRGELTLDFVDATHGWAMSSGSLWRTVNGGVSWALVHAFKGSYVGDVDFVDSTHGWAYAVGGGSDTVSTIMETSNAGKTWRTVRSLDDQWVVCLHAKSASGLAFVSGAESQASLFDPIGEHMTLAQTSDGGGHWTTQRVGPPLFTAALAGSGSALCAVGDGILTSSDGGVTWAAASSGQLYAFTAAAAVSATDLWAVEYGGALLHSSDGSTWTEQPGLTRWSQQLSAVSFPDADHGWVVGATQPFAEGGVILHTSDGGATWAPQASTLGGGLSGVDFVDDAHGWAITDEPFSFGSGAGASLEFTTDGGVTWTTPTQSLKNNPILTAVSFVSDTTGWVAGRDDSGRGGAAVIFKTTDGGKTWAGEALPSGMEIISGLQFLDENVGWAVGSEVARGAVESWLLHTTDGGATWTRVRLPFFGMPTPIRFLDDQHGWIGGDGVWSTNDGGATWSEVGGMADVSGLAVTDATHVWAFGDGIVSTVDGGSGDVAPPQTLDDADWSWHRKPVIITLKASDTGGSGVAETQYRTDGDTSWQSGASIAVPAPADHSYDGQHTYLYRSSDNAGNAEATEICAVGIDTLGPVCSAPKQPTAGFKKPAIVRFRASDQTSGVAVAVVRIVTRSGHVMKTLVSRASTSWGGSTPYYWLRFNCTFKPGLYRVTVSALDYAGNRQVVIGRSYLHIVRSGAPAAKAPAWPAGLPGASTPAGAPESFAARLGQATPLGLSHRLWPATPDTPPGR